MVSLDILRQRIIQKNSLGGFVLSLECFPQIVRYEKVRGSPLIRIEILSSRGRRGIQVILQLIISTCQPTREVQVDS